jgi:putative heme-binding domain-containing protein
MMRTRWFVILFALSLAATTALAVPAPVERWADSRLPIHGGLVLWLDASRQSAGRQSMAMGAVPQGGSLGVFLDGSGHGRHMVQRWGDAQPKLVSAGRLAVVRFDGRDDHLAFTGPPAQIDDNTVFLVASPRANPGGFVALLAGNAIGRRDYETGFTIDQSFPATSSFDTLNVEGKGFGGALDLMTERLDFQSFHVLEVRAGAAQVELTIDGRRQGRRDRARGPLRIDELTLGARFYTNDNGPQVVRGFFPGDVAEVLVFDRALGDDECRKVRDYLTAKYSGIDAELALSAASSGHAPRRVADPPPVQVLVPGIAADKLPLDLPNINNVRYRSDGKLVALAYDGDIYLLSDKDGDGREEHADKFWDNRGRVRAPIGMALTPPGYPGGRGVFVASKGKCSLIIDRDGDDRADEEVIVATGWRELEHGVDALGVALADDGSVYFGLGAADFTNAYLIDPAGKSHFDLKSERGTIQRVSSDFKQRETVATGIRFPVALAFHPSGDLFATDQEGATWLANGNPFDELLHIEPNRHYGFPPRHSRYLPNVVDEPSVFDYGPQHESTCGLIFNEPVGEGRVFGPGAWRGDAIVSGYSRGKLFRTQLARANAGYIARSQVIAYFNMLVVDSCVAPDGGLIVSTHGGGPDWGNGPQGRGAMYKLWLDDREAPQPVAAWAESPREVRVAFDRPLTGEVLARLANKVAIEYGPSLAAGDRFESQRPGYAVVAAQLSEPRFDLAVRGIQAMPDRRTLVIAVDPMSAAVSYGITLPGFPRRGLRQEPTVDLGFDQSGVRAAWRSQDGSRSWEGWLPHPDLVVSRTWLRGSAEHDRLWPLLDEAGALSMAMSVDPRSMLRPTVQPGSIVNDELPPERVTFTWEGSSPMRLTVSTGRLVESNEGRRAEIELPPGHREMVPVRIEMSTGSKTAISAAWHTADDSRHRVLSPARLRLPWALEGKAPGTAVEPSLPPELVGGNWFRGKQAFFGAEARCGQCHTVRGEGAKIGPDLSNLVHRDYASVLRDIEQPSFALNPDFITYHVALVDGRVLSGPVRSSGEQLIVGSAEGKETLVAKSDVEVMQPSPISTMPEGLTKGLTPETLKDVLTFLLAQDLAPARIEREGAPPVRSLSEVRDILGEAAPAPGRIRPLRIALVSGPKDHGTDEHDYPVFQRRWAALLSRAEGVSVDTVQNWPGEEVFAKADVLVWNSANPAFTAARAPQLDAFLARGGGMVFIHYAVNGRGATDEFARRIGLAWRDGHSRFRHGPLDLKFPAAANPITAGFKTLHLEDESYWDLIGDPKQVEVLATSREDGRDRPVIWARTEGRGRVFGMIPGHYTWTFDDPLYRILLLRGIAWAAGEPVDRFRDLVTLGARIEEPRGAAPKSSR